MLDNSYYQVLRDEHGVRLIKKREDNFILSEIILAGSNWKDMFIPHDNIKNIFQILEKTLSKQSIANK